MMEYHTSQVIFGKNNIKQAGLYTVCVCVCDLREDEEQCG